MTSFGYNNKYITKDNKPYFPIMGEMHYSRFPEEEWETSLYKIKAGGVDIVSAYVIWIHHEEIEGEYDFEGNKNLRAFVEKCKAAGLYMMLRIGPWCHGEVRNGGFPDWLFKKGFEPRTNDERYFTEVKKYYSKIYEQIHGLLLKDGGPIIGVQIENEYGHCGGLDGEEGEAHMRRLTEIAKAVGFEVPLYTATGWGGAVTGGLLPVMGGYCDAPWDQRVTEIEPSGNFIFTHERNDHNIGSDHGFGTGITFNLNKFPYLTAELGGGLQITRHRRPIATGRDIGAMSLVKLGSGVNLLGYYMYHGGTNPKGTLTTLEESRKSGYLNDLPKYSYDFRASIREYGQVSDTYKEIKLLTTFIKDFGEELCLMPAEIPEDNPLFPTNYEDLRYSWRHDGEKGYLFINNYQRRRKMEDHYDVSPKLRLVKETVIFPEFTVKNGEYFFYPFNMPIGDKAVIKTALATPLCKLNMDSEQGRAVVFYSDRAPEYRLEGDLEDIKLLTLSREEAKNSWKVKLDKEYIIIANGAVIQKPEGIEFIGREDIEVKVYPALKDELEGFDLIGTDGEFQLYRKSFMKPRLKGTFKEKDIKNSWKSYDIELSLPEERASDLEDIFLKLDYVGEIANLYVNGEIVADNFYDSDGWEVSLKRFGYPTKLTLQIKPLYEKAEIYLENWPPMKEGLAWELRAISLEPQYHTIAK